MKEEKYAAKRIYKRNDTTIEKRAMKQIQPKNITGVVNLDKI